MNQQGDIFSLVRMIKAMFLNCNYINVLEICVRNQFVETAKRAKGASTESADYGVVFTANYLFGFALFFVL